MLIGNQSVNQPGQRERIAWEGVNSTVSDAQLTIPTENHHISNIIFYVHLSYNFCVLFYSIICLLLEYRYKTVINDFYIFHFASIRNILVYFQILKWSNTTIITQSYYWRPLEKKNLFSNDVKILMITSISLMINLNGWFTQ